MTIPGDWLVCETTPDEVEEGLAGEWLPDLWLRQWRALVARLDPGDELWEYFGEDVAPLESERAGDVLDVHAGFALVRDGEVLDWIEARWL